VESSAAILDTLGLKNADLERAQESFSRLWCQYDFRVKTFQEGLGLTGVNLGVLGNKVVPDYSSLLGDQRERAETIQANHMNMCRFTSVEDPNYLKVAGELRSIHFSLVELNALKVHKDGLIQREGRPPDAPSEACETRTSKITSAEEDRLRSLWFPAMHTRRQRLENPADRTCLWLFEHDTYRDWFSGRIRDQHCGLLWLNGKPGAGKSVLMKEAFHRATQEQLGPDDCLTASFFFNARGDVLERTPEGIFRSILFQLLSKSREHLKKFTKTCEERDMGYAEDQGSGTSWQASELQRFFSTMYTQQPTKRTLIFIDGLDECDMIHVRSQAYFWRQVTKSAHTAGIRLDVCLSSRHFPFITISDCAVITVEEHNALDIRTYVEQKFKLGIATEEPHWSLLRDKVLGKAAGVFLWVVLVVEDVLKKWDEGKGLQFLLKLLDVVPAQLGSLFTQMFLDLDTDAKKITLRLFQWATLAVKPLRLDEWHHVLAFIREPTPTSLGEWRTSDYFTGSDNQLERQIKNISKGLLEVKTIPDQQETQRFETISILAEAGSLNLGHGGTRVVEVIHESVREFFLQNNGFSILDPELGSNPIGKGHLSIMGTCLDYLDISELDALVEARHQAGNQACDPHHTTMPKLPSPSAPIGVIRRPMNGQGNPVAGKFSPPLSREQVAQLQRNDSALGLSNTQLLHPCPSWLGRAVKDEGHDRKYSSSGPRGHRAEGNMSTLAAAEAPSTEPPDNDIIGWLYLSNAAEPATLYGSVRTTSTCPSLTGQSRILEDNPSLLFYATFEFFSHAEIAEERDVDTSPIIRRLQDGKTWIRWVALREDIAHGTQLSHYVAQWGPETWSGKCKTTTLEVMRPKSRKTKGLFALGGSSDSKTSLLRESSATSSRLKKRVFDMGCSSHSEASLDKPANQPSLGRAGPSSRPVEGIRPENHHPTTSSRPEAAFWDGLRDDSDTDYIDECAIDDDDESDWEESFQVHDPDAKSAAGGSVGSRSRRPQRRVRVASFSSASSYVGSRRLQRQMSSQASWDADSDWDWDDVVENQESSGTKERAPIQRVNSAPMLAPLDTTGANATGRWHATSRPASVASERPAARSSRPKSAEGMGLNRHIPNKKEEAALKPMVPMPHATAQPQLIPEPYNPRKACQDLLATGLSESCRRQILWEQHRNKSAGRRHRRQRERESPGYWMEGW
jgi:hypothetical protein